jgi:hypothetical protein
MSDESGTSGAAPPSSGEMDRGAGEHDVQDVELVRQRQELNEARERLTRHRRDLMAYDERLEERRQEIDQDIQELNDYRRGLVRYRERLRILRRGLSVGAAAMSGTAFVGAALDSYNNFLGYATPEIWLGAAVTLAGLAIGTGRKSESDPEGNPPDQLTNGQ